MNEAVAPPYPARRYAVDQAIVDRYAAVSGDHNPLHLDPAFAAQTPFGRTIAHGMMTLCFLSESLQAWIGDRWPQSGSLDVTFLSPVFPGDIVTVQVIGDMVATPEGRQGWRAECRVGDRLVMAGEASVALRKEGMSHGTT